MIESAKDDAMWNAAYQLHLATGGRPGELAVIRGQDLYLTGATLTIYRTMTKDCDGHPIIGETTKTGSAFAFAYRRRL